MKKIICFALVFLLLFPSFTLAENTEPDINAEAAILFNPVTNEILFEKNADKTLPPASLTKIMTMLVSTKEMKKSKIEPTEIVTISENAWHTQGSLMYLNIGAQVPISEIQKGIAIVSGNDASVAMAEHLFGSTDSFVKEMNKEAKALKLNNTTFTSVHGFSDPESGDKSTARDLLTLTNYYIHQYPENMEIHGTKTFTTPKEFAGGPNDVEQNNHNPLLETYEGATGLKTGFVGKNYNLIGTVKRGKSEFIVVILNAKNPAKREQDAISLLNFGFSQYEKVVQGEKGEEIKELTVYKSKNARSTKVVLKNEASIVVNIKDLEKVEFKDNLPKYLIGGKKAGDKIGTRVLTDGKYTHEFDIVLTEDLDKSGPIGSFFDSIAMWFANLFL